MQTTQEQGMALLQTRFGKDTVIALATVDGTQPSVRMVDGYYMDGSFYVVTYASSSKMLQIAANPHVAISGEWMTAHAIGENLGWVMEPAHQALMKTLREAFATWYGNGDVDEKDPQTVILRLRLTELVLFADGERYVLNFPADN